VFEGLDDGVDSESRVAGDEKAKWIERPWRFEHWRRNFGIDSYEVDYYY